MAMAVMVAEGRGRGLDRTCSSTLEIARFSWTLLAQFCFPLQAQRSSRMNYYAVVRGIAVLVQGL